MPHICGMKKGSFFKEAYLPQKLAQKTSIETRYNLFQMRVSFYILNRIPVMAPILAPILGVHFFGEHISLKNETFAPFSATIQALSRTRAFLLTAFRL
jgi:hypothetical protein